MFSADEKRILEIGVDKLASRYWQIEGNADLYGELKKKGVDALQEATRQLLEEDRERVKKEEKEIITDMEKKIKEEEEEEEEEEMCRKIDLLKDVETIDKKSDSNDDNQVVCNDDINIEIMNDADNDIFVVKREAEDESGRERGREKEIRNKKKNEMIKKQEDEEETEKEREKEKEEERGREKKLDEYDEKEKDKMEKEKLRKIKEEDEERKKNVFDSVRMFKKQILDEIEINDQKNNLINDNNNNNNKNNNKNKYRNIDENEKENIKVPCSDEKTDEKIKNKNFEMKISEKLINLTETRIGDPSSSYCTSPSVLYWSEKMDLALGKEIRICLFDFVLISEKLTGMTYR